MIKSLPANIEAEQYLLGILLLGESSSWDEIAALVYENDFFQPAHKKIFSGIRELSEQSLSPDVVTVADALKKSNSLDQVGGTAYLSDLINQIPSSANISSYAKIIQEKSTLRKIIHTSEGFIKKAYDEDYSKIEQFLDVIESEIFKIGEEKFDLDLSHLKDLIKPGLKKLEELFHKKISTTGIPSSFPELDHLTSGFQSSELIILAARPSMGKTALSLNFALHNALQGKKVAFFSLEMSKEQLLLRLLSSLARINLSQLTNGQINQHQWKKLIEAAAKLSTTSFFIDDSSPLSPYEIKSKARRLQSKQGLDLLIVDYLQLMQLPGRAETREREVSEMSRLLKSFAKELGIPVIALSQLNRGVEARSNRRPILSDLRESGAIEQDADVIMMLYREDYYENKNTNEAEVIINKQRNGPTGTVTLRWVPEYGSFENNMPETQHIPAPDTEIPT